MSIQERNLRFETKQIHLGQESPDAATRARAVPIYASTAFVFDDTKQAEDLFALRIGGEIYGRTGNPTEGVFEARIAGLEGGTAAIATATGAAAVSAAIQAVAKSGDNIVASTYLYGGTFNLLGNTLPDYGVSAHFVDIYDTQAIEDAIDENTKAILIETLGNPNGNVADIEGIANIAHSHGLPLIVDNTFATPYLVRPIEYGADIVVHSATKFIGGHGTALGGVVVDAGTFDWAASGNYPWLSEPNPSYHGINFAKDAAPAPIATYIRAILVRDFGTTISPTHAFIFLQGLETLSLRVRAHVENTLKIVAYLQAHPQVEAVHHPSIEGELGHEFYAKYLPNGGSSIFTFDIKGGEQKARQFIEHLEVFSHVVNVADVKSLVCHPATTTHSQMTKEEQKASHIGRNTVRFSIGTENVEDLIEDIEIAFSAIQ